MTAWGQARQLQDAFGDALSEATEFRGEVTLTLRDPERVEEVCRYAKRTLGFDFLVDISSVDNYGEDPRWTVVYELYGLAHRAHLRLKTQVREEASELPSVVPVWRTANWHEREIFDMMGIRFRGHPDLRRILMWEGYPYHPLRKEFPLAGIETELPDPDIAAETREKVKAAPMAGGPFVASNGKMNLSEAEPSAKDESWNERREKPGT